MAAGAVSLEEHVPALGALLNDPAQPLSVRFRVLFNLKNIGGGAAIQEIGKCFKDESALLKHELAYCLGQMQDARAIPILQEVLADEQQEDMVRHEAGEALGAIADPSVRGILEKYSTHPCVVVAETCQIALGKLDWEGSEEGRHLKSDLSVNPFESVDPAPPCKARPTSELRALLMDKNASLFERYRALFALRNRNDAESARALVDGFEDSSALFRHEIAYVLGQMQNEAAVQGLIRVLQKDDEHAMVRHECAEALGSIANDECLPVLKKYAVDMERVVKESCVVALDMHEYENSSEFLTLEEGVRQLAATAVVAKSN